MAWAIITKPFEYRRPGKNVSFSLRANSKPQQLPQDVVEHAKSIDAGREVKAPTKGDAPRSAGLEGKVKQRSEPK
jgi:hypothetical protein